MAVSVPAAPLTQERSTRPLSTVPSPRRRHGEPLRRLDVAVETALGADLRMLYGLGFPVLFIVALMIPMFLAPSYWLDGAVLAMTVVVMGFVVVKFLKMLDEAPVDASLDPAGHPLG
jgi:hypothetical protein